MKLTGSNYGSKINFATSFPAEVVSFSSTFSHQVFLASDMDVKIFHFIFLRISEQNKTNDFHYPEEKKERKYQNISNTRIISSKR